MFCLHICLCTMCMPGACRGQKEVSDSVELELQPVISLWVLVKEPWFSERTFSAIKAEPSSPAFYYFIFYWLRGINFLHSQPVVVISS